MPPAVIESNNNGHGPILYDLEEEEEVEMVSVTIGGWRGNNNDSTVSLQDDSLTGDRQANERLLSTAFVSFMAFTIVQSVASYIAKSEAMMADSASMLVDSLTYLVNLMAERRKSRFEEYWEGTDEQDPERRKRIKERAKRVMVLKLEIVPPILSVITLIGVTIVILRDSLTVIMLDAKRDKSEQGDPNINLMLAFSLLNLLLDAMNVVCFARANRLCGYVTSRDSDKSGERQTPRKVVGALSFEQKYAAIGEDDEQQQHHQQQNGEFEDEEEVDFSLEGPSLADRMQNLKSNDEGDDDKENESNGNEKNEDSGDDDKPLTNGSNGYKRTLEKNESDGRHAGDTEGVMVSEETPPPTPTSSNLDSGIPPPSFERQETLESQLTEDEAPKGEETNLNMCSAYTHVFADTLRSIAVVIAATTAEVADSVTSEEADAAAAIVVSILILLSLVPLLNGLAMSLSELRMIRAEQKSEKMFPSTADSTNEIT